MIRSTTPSWVASSASSSRPPPATRPIAPSGTPAPRRRPRWPPRPARRWSARPARSRAARSRCRTSGPARCSRWSRSGGPRRRRPRRRGERAPGAGRSPLGRRWPSITSTDRVGQGGDAAHVVGDRRHPLRVEAQAVEQRGAEAAPRARPPCRGRWPRPPRRRARPAGRRSPAGPRPWLSVSSAASAPRRALGGEADVGGGAGGRGHGRQGYASAPRARFSPARSSRGARPPRARAADTSRTRSDFRPLTRRSSSRRVAADPLADRGAVVHHLDRVAGIEVAGHVDDPDGQQRRPAVAQRPRRPAVDDHASRGSAWRTSATA